MLGFSREFFCPFSTQLTRCQIRDNSKDAFVNSALLFLGAARWGSVLLTVSLVIIVGLCHWLVK